MTTLNSLKLVTAKRPSDVPPVVQRRNRLVAKIWEQTELAKSMLEGKAYAPLHTRKVKDRETGEARRVETPKRVKAWWFTADNGKVCLTVKYGAKVLELAKGKSAIEVGTMAELIPTLDVLKAAVDAGELDTQLVTASETLRTGFVTK
ncbi:DUF6641 family protein [Massilia timonae]|uniref:DUF6641 family protein n=1 Tax=Massilia timonae TaxID=47229 RepID=UPI0028D41817|nr:DUF6641 family protein [Massilia timonae]